MYLPQTDTEFRNALQDAADLAVKAFAVRQRASWSKPDKTKSN